MTLGFTAFQLLELEDASCFRQSVPVWTSIFGCIILKEKLDRIEILLIVLIMIGLILVSRPSFLFGEGTHGENFLYGSIAGVLGAISASVAFIMVKKVKMVKPDTPNFVIINWLMLGGIFLSYPLALLSGNPFELARGWQILGVGLGGSFGFIGQYLMTAGLGMERVGPVMSVRSSDVILLFLLQGVIWGFNMQGLAYSAFGALAIMVGTISLGFHKWMKTRNDNDIGRLETELVNMESRNITIEELEVSKPKK